MLSYNDGEKRYILHPYNLKINSIVISDYDAPIVIGNTLPLCKVPLGENVHNIEFRVDFNWKNYLNLAFRDLSFFLKF